MFVLIGFGPMADLTKVSTTPFAETRKAEAVGQFEPQDAFRLGKLAIKPSR